jgi:steroid 5-alpha reductase family enzyme
LTSWDFIISALFVLNLTIQFIADQQQWDYQNFKRDLDSNGKPKTSVGSVVGNGKSLEKISGSASEVKSSKDSSDQVGKSMFAEFDQNDKARGFVSKGLWAWSRHPNFACEQTTW